MLECPEKCANCDPKTGKCLSCKDNSLVAPSCLAKTCDEGLTLIQNNYCIQCQPFCSSCDNEVTCLTCKVVDDMKQDPTLQTNIYEECRKENKEFDHRTCKCHTR